MTLVARLAALVLVATAAPALAEGPSFDCAKASVEAEVAICASRELAALDRELALLYVAATTGPTMTEARRTDLRRTQRGWITTRNDCWRAARPEACLRLEYGLRILALRTAYADARAARGSASRGPVTFLCEGAERPVHAGFIDTATPLAALSWGETVAVLPLTPTSHGARYVADGQEFWNGGETAIMSLPGATDLPCRRAPGE